MSDTSDTETETETGTNTDTTGEPTKAELHDRVQQLESTVEKLMPSRRDALKLGAAGLAGAAGLSATTQPADAATGSAGQIGDSSNRPDIFADTVDVNQLTGVSTGDLTWEEDANSPFSVSGAGNISGSLSGTGFDEYLFILKNIAESGNSNSGAYQLRVSGVSAQTYDYVDETGTRVGGEKEIILCDGLNPLGMSGLIHAIEIDGNRTTIGFNVEVVVGDALGTVTTRASFSGTDVTSFEILHTSSSNLSGAVEIYHR